MMKKIIINEDIFLIENFLSNEECNNYINSFANVKFEEAKVNIGGKQTMLKQVRNNERYMFKDEQLADVLWKRALPFLVESKGMYFTIGFNELLRVYKYTKGQRFKMHRDGIYERNQLECSFYSFLIYLNDDYEGGNTAFRNGEEIELKKGNALVFYHDLLHEGKAIISGTKYVLRTDVMYKMKQDENKNII